MSQGHQIARACVMTPHVVVRPDNAHEAITGELPDEARQQGYHRKFAYIECECGERFDGASAKSQYGQHLDDVMP